MRKLAGSCWQLAVSKINETERLLRKTKFRVEALAMTFSVAFDLCYLYVS